MLSLVVIAKIEKEAMKQLVTIARTYISPADFFPVTITMSL